nr:hypothetical protein [Bacteroidota bacterium]
MFNPFVTSFIKEKDVKKKFSEIFIKPEIDVPLLNNQIDYNAPLLGNALDYFITCHFNYLIKSETDSFVETANHWLLELKKDYVQDITPEVKVAILRILQCSVRCHFTFLNNKEKDCFIRKTKKSQDKLEKFYNSVSGAEKEGIVVTQYKINCHFKFPNKIKREEFTKESIPWLKELIEIYVSETSIGKKSREKKEKTYPPEKIFYTCHKFKNSFLDYSLRFGDPSSDYDIFSDRENVFYYSAKEISDFIKNSLKKYNEYKLTGKITDSFLLAILT